jgi:energy-coupling factor transporter ATP-binding protein EcfA2
MSDERIPLNQVQGPWDSELFQILRVILTNLTPKAGITLPSLQARGVTVSPQSGVVALWSIGSEEDVDPYYLAHAVLGLDSREQLRRVLLIRPRMAPDIVTSMADRLKEQLIAILKDRPLPAIEIWATPQVEEQMSRFQPLLLRYHPDDLADGPARVRRIESNRPLYDEAFRTLHGKIQFVGMSVYKEEATAAVDMDSIYIPLRLVDEDEKESRSDTPRSDPLTLLEPGAGHLILGDPGCGKSTLLKFLALAGTHERLRQRYKAPRDDRLPILVTVRQYADALKADYNVDLLDFIVRTSATDLNLPELDREFFEYHLYAGKALLFFDGIDELPGIPFKLDVRQRIGEFVGRYPGNTTIVTSRIVGYEADVRYDSLGFAHRRVARLMPGEIEQFVINWYRARVPNGTERQRHVADLIQILRESNGKAIRELAENPLLLTIICLVHRVDAVLPDQRVVLYQKCTETLLNTWHTWKFRGEDTQNRSRTEKQHRARMEAIAYWMHMASDAPDPSQRAMVSEIDLIEFLSGYIRDIEHPRNSDSRELAELFLRFIRERAGLLIEVGQGRFSFLHLTFQEYLAATHLRKSGELGGIEVIWTVIEDKCGNPRWHEVVRLLIASLELDKSQHFLLRKIIPGDHDDDLQERALLAGGCLIDRVAPAEEMASSILRAVLTAAIRAVSTDDLQKPLRQLSLLGEREADLKKVIVAEASRLYQEGPACEPLALVLVVLGWSDREIRDSHPALIDQDTDFGRHFRNFLAEEPTSEVAFTEQERDRLWTAQCVLSSSILASLALISATGGGRPGTSIPSFEHLLVSLFDSIGSFFTLVAQAISFGPGIGSRASLASSDLVEDLQLMRSLDRFRKLSRSLEQSRKRIQKSSRSRSLDRSLDWSLDWSLDRSLDRSRKRPRKRSRKRSRTLGPSLDRTLGPSLDRYFERAMDRSRSRARASEANVWSILRANRKYYSWILDMICETLELRPMPLWFEALRVRFLPKDPGRITLADPDVWHRTLLTFRDNTATAADCSNAAAQLLLDGWLYLTKCIKVQKKSPFAELANLTRRSTAAELRIAHCIRDLSYGDESRADDLKAMVQSNDPELVRIFRRAGWID